MRPVRVGVYPASFVGQPLRGAKKTDRVSAESAFGVLY